MLLKSTRTRENLPICATSAEIWWGHLYSLVQARPLRPLPKLQHRYQVTQIYSVLPSDPIEKAPWHLVRGLIRI